MLTREEVVSILAETLQSDQIRDVMIKPEHISLTVVIDPKDENKKEEIQRTVEQKLLATGVDHVHVRMKIQQPVDKSATTTKPNAQQPLGHQAGGAEVLNPARLFWRSLAEKVA